ncbi:MAG: prolyl oligopeptidase family serine peptidase [Acidobacteria bacterium]|nr:prolyl oligopeptidase family serine peptidase [Acidobacteriota bacterium]
MFGNRRRTSLYIGIVLGLFILSSAFAAGGQKALTFEDIMKFKEIRRPALSVDGSIVVYAVEPDRGDGGVFVHHRKTGAIYSVDRGSAPRISNNARWVVMTVRPAALETAKAEKDKPRQGMAILDTKSGEVVSIPEVQEYALSKDGEWLAYLLYKPKDQPESKKPEADKEKTQSESESPADEKKEEKKREVGAELILRRLENGEEKNIAHVLKFQFAEKSSLLAYTTGTSDGAGNAFYLYGPGMNEQNPRPLYQQDDAIFGEMGWAEAADFLAFTVAEEKGEYKESFFSVWLWTGEGAEAQKAVATDRFPGGWMLPAKNSDLRWSKDGTGLFLGLKPTEMAEKKSEKKKDIDLFDPEQILAERGLDIWHGDDPFINSHQKILWPRVKDQTYTAVFYPASDNLVPLADEGMPDVIVNNNPDVALGLSDVPYRKEITWDGDYSDVYVVDLKTGKRTKIVERLGERPQLSPEGKYILYYQDRNWHLYSVQKGETTNLTSGMDVPFYDEDHDYPSAVPGYGTGGWIEGDTAALIYDKFDVWKFSLPEGKALCLTGGEGRRAEKIFRVLQTDPDRQYYKAGENLLLTMYHDREKHFGFYAANTASAGVRRLLEDKKKFQFLAKAKKADVLLYTREDFREFPDLWAAAGDFAEAKKISDVNPQIADFAWGTPELVEWNSLDGIPLQGVLIKPAGYEPGKRYPVIVYYYRFFSQRLYEFNQMVVNHRPNFPYYTSNGYAVFLPDIRFDVGHPGFSSTKCLVPGVQKLIDLGIADPKAVGLHGHSWSGYQTAFMVTQTNLFACCIAGAPVSNMTSAYGGIRWASGLSRQFQYEKSQSRIGGSLWEYPERYIENSPVFFADRIQTPMLIMFGDEDGAVPWYQGIELYMALRRLGKDCIFLQYRGEPHHPQKYANKLDYSIRMKEYFDVYLKGQPAPDWIKKGVPYRGK